MEYKQLEKINRRSKQNIKRNEKNHDSEIERRGREMREGNRIEEEEKRNKKQERNEIERDQNTSTQRRQNRKKNAKREVKV